MSRGYFLNSDILEAFMRGFFGYGNLKSRVWFIGMRRRLADNDFPKNQDGALIGKGPTRYLLLPHPSRFTKDQTFLNAGVTMRLGGITI